MSAREHNKNLLKELAIGDLVEFPRHGYSHWAVYIGDGEVIHLAGRDGEASSQPQHVSSIGGKMFSKAEVCVGDFMEVAGENKALKNNKNDTKWRPRPPSEIVAAARSRLGERKYNVLYSNCEHFANWCRYGIEKSEQVDNIATVGTAVYSSITKSQ